MAYAQLGEEIFERQAELLCEEFRLYCLVFFHSYPDKNGRRVCRMEIEELCRIYNLDYTNTTRRIKRMRTGKFSKGEKPKKVAPMKSAWLFQTKEKYLVPLVGLKRTVNITVPEDEKTVNITDGTVNITVPDCNIYSKSASETVNITVPYIKDLKKPLKNPQNTLPEEKNGAGSNDHLSEFSKEEILRYVEIRQKNGEFISNPHGLVTKAYQTGEMDVFIKAILYPESELTCETDSNQKLREALYLLREVREEGENWQDFQKWYSAEEWQWLTAEMAK